MRQLNFWIQYIALPFLLFAVSCSAWGYHHPSAYRLPTSSAPKLTESTSTPHVTFTPKVTTTATVVTSNVTVTPKSFVASSTENPSTFKASSTSALPSSSTSLVLSTSTKTQLTTATPLAPLATSTKKNENVVTTETTKRPSTSIPNATTATAATAPNVSSTTTTLPLRTMKNKENEMEKASFVVASLSTPAPTIITNTEATTKDAEATTTFPPVTQKLSSLPSVYTVPNENTSTTTIPLTSASQEQLFASEHMTVVSRFPKSETSTSQEKQCVRNESEISYWDFGSCSQSCNTTKDCIPPPYETTSQTQCQCDGPCGFSCVEPDLVSIYCDAPGTVENGKALLIGELGLYDYRNQLQRFMHNQKILFECDEGFTLIDGPQEKICRNGLWFPAVGEPKCVFSDTPGFRWMQSNRVKRKAIKSGGSSLARSRVGGGGGGGGGAGRRGKKKGGDDEDEDGSESGSNAETISCPALDEEYDRYIQVEVVQQGSDPNNTEYSVGVVVKVSCSDGYGISNLQKNDTITCDERGRWRPKIPACTALPCKVPYISHGTFYISGKALFFLEMRPHDNHIELRCSTGYVLNGQSKFHCWYGEWDVTDAPECIPASCDLPQLDRGSYTSRFRPGMVVGHGTEVDYHCDGEFQKMPPGGPAKCHLGDWRPNKPACFHPSYINGMRNFTHDKDNRLITSIKRSCGIPRKEEGAIFYVEGKPIDYETDYIFPDGTEVMYRCAAAKPKLKTRWKMVCEDGQWISGGFSNFTCDLNTSYVTNITSIKDTIRMINASCEYRKKDTHVITFMNDVQLTMDSAEFPPGSILINRCSDIGKFKMKGAIRRKCISGGQWLGIGPKCEGLSQYYDYVVDKPPTILFRYLNGSIVQSNEGKLIVYPGTTLHMECLYIRKFGTPQWNVSNTHKKYPIGWADDEHRDPTLEYRLTIENADESDTGTFECKTPSRHGHSVNIIVKKVDCPQLPERSDLVYSTDSVKLGTKVAFQCKEGNTLIGAKEIVCQSTGSWNAPLPKCENVECPDISMVPAMAPLDYSSAAKNGSLKKSETAPPKISIMSKEVGGKAVFSCAPGYTTEGASEAICLETGAWSSPIPVCKEVVCPPPSPPQNGSLSGNPPYKAGDLIQIECDSGFMMEGQPIVVCQENGKFSRSSSATKCVKACTYPGTTIGGTISAVKYYYAIGDTVEYDCTEGYDLKGSRMLHCLPTAQWSNSTPICIPKNNSDSAGR